MTTHNIFNIIHTSLQNRPGSPTVNDLINTCTTLDTFYKETIGVNHMYSTEKGELATYDPIKDILSHMSTWYKIHSFDYDTNYRIVSKEFVEPLMENIKQHGFLNEKIFQMIISGITLYDDSDRSIEKTTQKLNIAHLLNEVTI